MKHLSLSGIWTPRTYNWLAKYYDKVSFLFSPEISHKVILEDLKEGLLLDVGCGTGRLLSLAAEIGMASYGLDTSSGMLNEARAKMDITYLTLSSFYQIPFPDNHFDYVVETNALGGVEIDCTRALSEMLRVCKNDGEVRLVDYVLPNEISWKNKLLINAGMIIGDTPVDFTSILQELGCKTEITIIGGAGMYQLIKAVRA